MMLDKNRNYFFSLSSRALSMFGGPEVGIGSKGVLTTGRRITDHSGHGRGAQ